MNQDDLGSEAGVRAALEREYREELAASEGIGPDTTPWLYCARLGDLTEAQWEMAAHVVHAFRGLGGWPGSTFVQRLFAAIEVADRPNRDRLAKGFPEYVGWWRELSGNAVRVAALTQSVNAHYAVPEGGR